MKVMKGKHFIQETFKINPSEIGFGNTNPK